MSKTVKNLLNKRFGISATLYSRKERDNWKTSYFVEIRGKESLDKWMKKIGFRNIKNTSKIELWKMNINPQQPFDIRIKLLNRAHSSAW